MKIEEGKDYYFNEQGNMVLTAHYLEKRGYCCGNGCKHCPYDYQNVPEPRRSSLRAARTTKPNNSQHPG
jgi:hypothetical protein